MSRPAVVVAALAALGLLAGCNATKRELTVVFAPSTTADQRAAVLRACADAAPRTSPEPVIPPQKHFTSPGIRFRIDKANDREIAQLEACLQRQPGVIGFQDSAAT